MVVVGSNDLLGYLLSCYYWTIYKCLVNLTV